MLGHLSANRLPYLIADLADLATILEIVSRPLTVICLSFVMLLFSHSTLPALTSSSLLHTPSLAVLSKLLQVPLSQLVLIASLFPFFIHTPMFSCCDWHPVTSTASFGCPHFSRCSFARFHMREPSCSVFTVSAVVTFSSLTVIDLASNPFTSRRVLFYLRMCCIDVFISPPLMELEHTGTLT